MENGTFVICLNDPKDLEHTSHIFIVYSITYISCTNFNCFNKRYKFNVLLEIVPNGTPSFSTDVSKVYIRNSLTHISLSTMLREYRGLSADSGVSVSLNPAYRFSHSSLQTGTSTIYLPSRNAKLCGQNDKSGETSIDFYHRSGRRPKSSALKSDLSWRSYRTISKSKSLPY